MDSILLSVVESRLSAPLASEEDTEAARRVLPRDEPARVEELQRTSVLCVDAPYERIRPASRRWWREGYGCLLDLFFLSSFLSPPGILLIFIRYNCLFAGKTTTPPLFFFLWRGLMESRFNYNILLVM